jgi:hypothetical protein
MKMCSLVRIYNWDTLRCICTYKDAKGRIACNNNAITLINRASTIKEIRENKAYLLSVQQHFYVFLM